MNTEQFIIDKYKVDTTKEPPYHLRISRWKTLPYIFLDLGYKVGAEIGVETGRFSGCLLWKIPNLKLYSIDCWKTSEGYRNQLKDRTKLFEKRAHERLDVFGERSVIIKKYSMDAVKDFEDESLDFVFIDANHDFEHCTEDIREWSKKVRKGGIVSGHDFRTEDCGFEMIDVERAVTQWVKDNNIKIWFVGEGREQSNIWLYVKE